MNFNQILGVVANNKTRTVCGFALAGVLSTYVYMLASY